MSDSYKKINYRLRPAKSIERKMLCDSFRRLREFSELKQYLYIGFGSTYFHDFNLFHKELGINRMISIEKSEHDKPRFIFNKPFSCIDLKFGHSNDILPTLDFGSKNIIWMDYEKALNSEVIADIDFIVSNIGEGNIFMISVNAGPIKPSKRDEYLDTQFAKQFIPADVKKTDFAKWGTAKIYRRIITNRIKQKLKETNSALSEDDRLNYKQLYNFHYKDGVEMLTVGGIFYRTGQEHIIAKCNFESLEFIQDDETPYVIVVPNLTLKEIRYIDTQLPCDDITELETLSIPESDITNYQKNYRYFPRYSEVEI